MFTKMSKAHIDGFFKSTIDQQKPSRTADELQKMENLLNQQRIELIFGQYKVNVLFQENTIRVSNLNADGVMRTCAVVHFDLPVPAWLEATHQQIYNGASIGKAIKDNGFELIKEPLYFGISQLPEIARQNMQTDENAAAVHIYQSKVINPTTSESFSYCTIIELHHPLYLTLGDLCALYPQDTLKYKVITEVVQQHLDTLSKIDELIPTVSPELN